MRGEGRKKRSRPCSPVSELCCPTSAHSATARSGPHCNQQYPSPNVSSMRTVLRCSTWMPFHTVIRGISISAEIVDMPIDASGSQRAVTVRHEYEFLEQRSLSSSRIRRSCCHYARVAWSCSFSLRLSFCRRLFGSHPSGVLVLPCHELSLLLPLPVKEGLVVLPTGFHAKLQLHFVGSCTARLCRSSPETNSETPRLQALATRHSASPITYRTSIQSPSKPLARALEAALESRACQMSRRTAQSCT